jgi:hypothetical protein
MNPATGPDTNMSSMAVSGSIVVTMFANESCALGADQLCPITSSSRCTPGLEWSAAHVTYYPAKRSSRCRGTLFHRGPPAAEQVPHYHRIRLDGVHWTNLFVQPSIPWKGAANPRAFELKGTGARRASMRIGLLVTVYRGDTSIASSEPIEWGVAECAGECPG